MSIFGELQPSATGEYSVTEGRPGEFRHVRPGPSFECSISTVASCSENTSIWSRHLSVDLSGTQIRVPATETSNFPPQKGERCYGWRGSQRTGAQRNRVSSGFDVLSALLAYTAPERLQPLKLASRSRRKIGFLSISKRSFR
jgi:hypothetical protein